MRTMRFTLHKTYHVRIKLIAGLIAYFFMDEQEFEDEACTGQYRQTFCGLTRVSYHVLYSPIDFDLHEVWTHIKDYAQDNNKLS